MAYSQMSYLVEVTLAAVVNNSVISFAEGLSGMNREYIRKSYLLASSYVSDVLNVHRGTEDWYDEFIKVMVSLGWLPVRSSFERVSRSGKGLTVQLAALNLIAGLLASTSLTAPLLMLPMGQGAGREIDRYGQLG